MLAVFQVFFNILLDGNQGAADEAVLNSAQKWTENQKKRCQINDDRKTFVTFSAGDIFGHQLLGSCWQRLYRHNWEDLAQLPNMRNNRVPARIKTVACCDI
jgi:hypothetical protein